MINMSNVGFKCFYYSKWKMMYVLMFIIHNLWSVVSSTRNVPVAVILPKNNDKWYSLSRVKPAIDIALQRTSSILEDTQLTVRYADSKCHISEAINEAINFYMKDEANAFFGPCCDYAAAPIARQIRYWNLPMLTSGAMAGDFGLLKTSTFPLLTRVGHDINSLARFVFSFLEAYGWHKVKILFDEIGQEDVIERLCHLVADGLHNAILKRPENDTHIEHDHFKFQKTEEILDKLTSELGKTYSGKL